MHGIGKSFNFRPISRKWLKSFYPCNIYRDCPSGGQNVQKWQTFELTG